MELWVQLNGKAFEYLENGTAHILYVSPEMLRSRSIETMLKRRNVVRFVIDGSALLFNMGTRL